MGGHAFEQNGIDGSPAVKISRLSPSEYNSLKSNVADTLTIFFEQVRPLQEAPGKADYGDIDFLVEGPQRASTPEHIKEAISATALRANGGPITNFAVPFIGENGETRYAQVDLQTCHKENIDWLTFHQSYGDLWQILGTIIRRYGLTANDKGLFLRIEEGEERNWQGSMVFLSRDPAAVVTFLGMDWGIFEAGFATLDDIFNWLAQCRLIDIDIFVRTAQDHRQRNIKTRPMFRRFLEEFVPALPAKDADTLPSRSDVLHQALESFGARSEYEEKHRAILDGNLEVKATDLALQALRPSEDVSKNATKNLNLVIRSIKRWTRLIDGHLELRTQPEMDVDGQLKMRELLDSDQESLNKEHAQWMKDNFEELKTVEKQRMKEAKEARKENGSRMDHD